MTIKKIDDMEQQPTLAVLIKRNLMLLLFPVEGVVILRDSYARRLADKWWGTVVIDDRNALRGTLRILLGNIILFGFFSIAIISQRSGIEKTAIFQTAEQAIRSHEKLKPILEQYPAIEDPEASHCPVLPKPLIPRVVSSSESTTSMLHGSSFLTSIWAMRCFKRLSAD